MSYKSILVHLSDTHRAPAMLAAATAIARVNDADLIGLSVLPPLIIVAGIEGETGIVIEDHRDRYRLQMAQLRAAFEAAVNEKPGLSHEWRELDCETENPFGIAASVVASQARTADLVIAAQENPAWSLSGHLDVAETVILDSGRPVLVMPRAGAPRSIGQRVVVAWNGWREATRAAFDALPLLQAATSVTVLSLGPEGDAARGSPTPGIDLCAALARHGVKCEAVQRAEPAAGAGPALLQAVDEFGADLLVMGCYGHSRLREMVLGGATRHVLRHAAVPVLMSH